MSFPSAPTVGQQVTEGGRVYAWDGYAWSLVANVASHTHAAEDIASGTMSDERLSFAPLHPFLLMGG